ncbi:hypothetical protein HAN_1g65 (nucleomorph) [Hemiselmis andersenii]|uniref:Uncharacterized protein n=2 Tax=Hemiselmis andersenii TaxID=464988 RepID=A9BK77_HEMAN|nr:hypothetical protein HAN_1g65 [Hemiselmis andersenii]ABW97910.1 hypothetical protein HAN_1g65 [Hemiselmis andersenii]
MDVMNFFETRQFPWLVVYEKIFFWLNFYFKKKKFSHFYSFEKKNEKSYFKIYDKKKQSEKKQPNSDSFFLILIFTFWENFSIENYFCFNKISFDKKLLNILFCFLEFEIFFRLSIRRLFFNYNRLILRKNFIFFLKDLDFSFSKILFPRFFSFFWILFFSWLNFKNCKVLKFKNVEKFFNFFLVKSGIYSFIKKIHYRINYFNFFYYQKKKSLLLPEKILGRKIEKNYHREKEKFLEIKLNLFRIISKLGAEIPEKFLLPNKISFEFIFLFFLKLSGKINFEIFDFEIEKKFFLNWDKKNFFFRFFYFFGNCFMEKISFFLFFYNHQKLKKKLQKNFFFYYLSQNGEGKNFKTIFLENLRKILFFSIKSSNLIFFSFSTNFFNFKLTKISQKKIKKLLIHGFFFFLEKIFFIVLIPSFFFFISFNTFTNLIKRLRVRKFFLEMGNYLFYKLLQKLSINTTVFLLKDKLKILKEFYNLQFDKIFLEKIKNIFYDQLHILISDNRQKFVLEKKNDILEVNNNLFQEKKKSKLNKKNVNYQLFLPNGFFCFLKLGIFLKTKEKPISEKLKIEIFKDTQLFSNSFLIKIDEIKKKFFTENLRKNFLPLFFFRTLRIFSRFAFLKLNKWKNLRWCYDTSKFLIKSSGFFCKKKKNFFFYLNFFETCILLAFNRLSFIESKSLIFFDNSLESNSYFNCFGLEKLSIVYFLPKYKTWGQEFLILNKSFRPKNKLCRSFLFEEFSLKNEETFSVEEPSDDNIYLTEAMIMKNIKTFDIKKTEILLIIVRKNIKRFLMDVRGLKIQIQILSEKGFISFSRKKKNFKYIPD